jgi:hypothetical protein
VTREGFRGFAADVVGADTLRANSVDPWTLRRSGGFPMRVARTSDRETDARLALARLADALAEDIMATPEEGLLAELGEARAGELAARMDAAFARAKAGAGRGYAP